MRGRLRYLLALGFALLFALLPAPDAERGRPFLGWLQVRGWLLGADSPLAAFTGADAAPRLSVELRQSPPIEDAALRRERAREYERIAEEWATARGVALGAAALPLRVIVGARGVRAEVPRPDGSTAVLDALFPTRASLLPAVVTIVTALLLRRVLLALLLGGLVGAIAYCLPAAGPGVAGALEAVGAGAWHYAADALVRRSVLGDFYLRITLFVTFLFMTVAVVTRNGGVHGTVALLQRAVRGPVSAQLVTWVTGLLIFFDDYTNCMVTGTTMRPLCDRAGVAREKLAYIVDSTAAPVAGVSLFSTWVAYEISQFRGPLALVTDAAGRPYTADDAYDVFLATLPFRFYCFLALLLVLLVVVLRRDLGPMLAAERRARRAVRAGDGPSASDGDAADAPDPGVPPRAANAVVPLLVLILGAGAATLGADVPSDVALAAASGAGLLTAVALTLGQRLLPPRRLLGVALGAVRGLVPAFGILFLAWSLGHVSADVGTSLFLCASVRDVVAAAALPPVLFLVAGAVSFATGTSFGTMAILLPNVVVLAHRLGTDAPFLGDPHVGGPALMLLSIGAVLEGSIFGDHCSPISDTTVLSSVGSRCDHLAHVATQLPYALLAAAAALLLGYLPMVLLGPAWWPLSYAAAILLLAAVLRLAGRDPGATSSA